MPVAGPVAQVSPALHPPSAPDKRPGRTDGVDTHVVDSRTRLHDHVPRICEIFMATGQAPHRHVRRPHRKRINGPHNPASDAQNAVERKECAEING